MNNTLVGMKDTRGGAEEAQKASANTKYYNNFKNAIGGSSAMRHS